MVLGAYELVQVSRQNVHHTPPAIYLQSILRFPFRPISTPYPTNSRSRCPLRRNKPLCLQRRFPTLVIPVSLLSTAAMHRGTTCAKTGSKCRYENLENLRIYMLTSRIACTI